jgi:hypothetical protein
MGILILAMLAGWVLTTVAAGLLVTWLISKTGVLSAGKIDALRLILTFSLVASPFIYWSYQINSVGALWAEECEKRTGYIFHSSPPLDLVSGPISASSWAESSWMDLARTDIRSLVSTDKQGRGLTGEDGSFVLRVAEANDPGCAPFYETVDRLNMKTPYLQGRCIAIEPLGSSAEVLKLEAKSGESKILHKSGSLVVREQRTLLQNADSKVVYAEYVSVSYRHPNVADNLFVMFSSIPRCEKLDVLENNNMHAQVFNFAFSAHFRAELEDMNSGL